MDDDNKKILGQYLTSIDIFNNYIYPQIEKDLYNYTWVDKFAGEGNLILPILSHIPENKRNDFFQQHIYLYDVDAKMIEKSIKNAIMYGIKEDNAIQNIKQLDSFLPNKINYKFPIFHITNPPYMYSVNAKKNNSPYITHLKEKKLQDLYQIALFNDDEININKMIYIIPVNFIYGKSVSNNIRKIILSNYNINKCLIFENQLFDAGINVGIFYFNRNITKNLSNHFIATKIKKNGSTTDVNYKFDDRFYLNDEFSQFVSQYKAKRIIDYNIYAIKSIIENNGCINKKLYNAETKSIDNILVNNIYDELFKNNKLFIRTLDSPDGKILAGIYNNTDIDKNIEGVYTNKSSRTQPIALFFNDKIDYEQQELLKDYVNFILNYYRKKLDSDFLRTFRLSKYCVRKFLGLNQIKDIINTFPKDICYNDQLNIRYAIQINDFKLIINILNKLI